MTDYEYVQIPKIELKEIVIKLKKLEKENKQLKEQIAKTKEAWIDYQMMRDDDPDFDSYVNYIILGKWEFER